MTHSQEALSAFSTPDTPSQPSQQDQPQQTEQTESKTEQTDRPTNPLKGLYEDVELHIGDTYPSCLQKQEIVTPLEPEAQQYRTNGIPSVVEALPDTIGQWKLTTHDDSHVSYLTDSPAFDTRYGEGGALYRFKLALNDSGMNKDGKYHLQTEKVVGYTNGSKIRSHSPEDQSPMLGIRGHSVGDNPGDFSVLGGTKQKFDGMREGIINLIALLHHTPAPVKNHLPSVEETSWKLTKYAPVNCIWTAPAPSSVPKEHLKLKLSNNMLRLVAYDDDDSLPDMDRTTAPLINSSLPSSLKQYLDSKSAYITAPSILVASEILTEDISTVVAKSDLTTTEKEA